MEQPAEAWRQRRLSKGTNKKSDLFAPYKVSSKIMLSRPEDEVFGAKVFHMADA